MEQYSSALFEKALEWLKDNYSSYHFFVERDIVWTLQLYMIKEAKNQNLPFKIYDNHKIVKGEQKHPDLVILDEDQSVNTVVELKYEPDHARADIDIFSGKFPRVFWNSKSGGIEPDIDRVRNFVSQGAAKVGFSVFIDEGNSFVSKSRPEGCRYVNWGQSPYSNETISVLIARFPPWSPSQYITDWLQFNKFEKSN